MVYTFQMSHSLRLSRILEYVQIIEVVGDNRNLLNSLGNGNNGVIAPGDYNAKREQ